MDFKTKRRNKKFAKLFVTLAYSMVILMVIIFVAIIISINNKNGLHQLSDAVKIIIFVSPLILGWIFALLGVFYMRNRLDFKVKIKLYRQRKFFLQALTLLSDNKLNEAINVHDNLLTDNLFKAFILPLILAKMSEIGTDEQKTNAENRLNEIFKEYSPEKVKFN